jgi:protein-S-isoprenylcysteine O-methyltransferase Ste14
MLVIYIRAAKFEEAKFSGTALGPEYDSYRSSTGLFIPNPFKRRFSGRRDRRAWQ